MWVCRGVVCVCACACGVCVCACVGCVWEFGLRGCLGGAGTGKLHINTAKPKTEDRNIRPSEKRVTRQTVLVSRCQLTCATFACIWVYEFHQNRNPSSIHSSESWVIVVGTRVWCRKVKDNKTVMTFCVCWYRSSLFMNSPVLGMFSFIVSFRVILLSVSNCEKVVLGYFVCTFPFYFWQIYCCVWIVPLYIACIADAACSFVWISSLQIVRIRQCEVGI